MLLGKEREGGRAFPRNYAVDDARRRSRIHERETAGRYFQRGMNRQAKHLPQDDKLSYTQHPTSNGVQLSAVTVTILKMVISITVPDFC